MRAATGGDADAGILQRRREGEAGELRSVVRVEDVGPTVPDDRLFERGDAEVGRRYVLQINADPTLCRARFGLAKHEPLPRGTCATLREGSRGVPTPDFVSARNTPQPKSAKPDAMQSSTSA